MVGASTFALHLSWMLSRQSKGKVLLLDMDGSNCLDVSVMLGIKPNASVLTLHKTSNRILEQDLMSQLSMIDNHLYFLPSLPKPGSLEAIDLNNLQMFIKLLHEHFQYIVCDIGSHWPEQALAIMELSNLNMFITSADILSLSKATHALEAYQGYGFSNDSVKIVVNKFEESDGMNESILMQKLKRPIFAVLPDIGQETKQALLEGKTIAQLFPRSQYIVVMDKILLELLTKNLIKPKAQHGVNSLNIVEQTQVEIGDQQDWKDEIKLKIHQRLMDVMDFKRLSMEEFNRQDSNAIEELREKTRQAVLSIIDELKEIKTRQDRNAIAKEVLNEALGLGPLEDLLSDSNITEIMVNGFNQIYCEQSGKLKKIDSKFTSNRQLLGVIERIVAPVGRRIDEKTPMVDARLKDGSRVHAIIPPLSINGPMLTIRKFKNSILTPKNLIELGAMSNEISTFLDACVKAKLNVLVSGGTGTGKTTLLNVLSNFIPNDERIITVEDSAELKLSQPHVGRLESRPANLQGEGAISIRELVRNTLRMRPDRIIVGECRGAEALDMLQAMNTGHDGSMTTIHSNSPKDCMARLETLVMFSGMDLPSKAIREQISSAINLVIQLSRLNDGSRKITAVTQVVGMSTKEQNSIELKDIFLYKQTGFDSRSNVVGHYVYTGQVPTFLDRFERVGINLNEIFFSKLKTS